MLRTTAETAGSEIEGLDEAGENDGKLPIGTRFLIIIALALLCWLVVILAAALLLALI